MDGMSGRLELLDQRSRRAPHALLLPAGDDQHVGMVKRPFGDLLAGNVCHVHVRTRRELETAKRHLALVRADSRIGYECSNHYFYLPHDLIEKVLCCRDVFDRLDAR